MTDPAEADREYRAEAAGSALELASTAYLKVASDIDIRDDCAEMDLTYLCDVLGYLEALQSATRTVRTQLGEVIASKLEGATYYRHRDSIVKVGGSGAWKVKEEKVNSGLLAAYIGAEWPQVVNLKASGAVTVTRIEGLAKKYASQYDDDFDPDSVAQTARDEFFEYKKNDSAISTMPLDKAPNKAVAALEHGQSWAPKPNKPRLEAGE